MPQPLLAVMTNRALITEGSIQVGVRAAVPTGTSGPDCVLPRLPRHQRADVADERGFVRLPDRTGPPPSTDGSDGQTGTTGKQD